MKRILHSRQTKCVLGLTTLGIIIGIASVIAMVAIGQGASATITSNIQGLGSNSTLGIIRGSAQAGRGVSKSRSRYHAHPGITEDATCHKKHLPVVAAVSARKAGEVSSGVATTGNNTNVTVVGATPAYQDARSVVVANGSYFTDAQVASDRARVAVLGPTVATDLFGADDPDWKNNKN